jgi:hypothetical protein
MSLIRVYLLAKTFVFRNEHFQLVFKLKTTLLKIRALESYLLDSVWQSVTLCRNFQPFKI